MDPHGQRFARFSRRRFLEIGAGTAGAVAVGSTALLGGEMARARPALADASDQPRIDPERFGRMFTLPPFAEATPQVVAALLDIGKPGGLLDAHDQLAAGPIALITDPALSVNNPDNPTHTAGTTFMGQFMDHDITFDIGSRLGHATPPQSAVNGRTPAFDLDSVYGAGPVASALLYDPKDLAKLRIESGGLFEDVPRTPDHTAMVGDPRNDEHVVISGLHAAFLLFHNRMVDRLRAGGMGDIDEVFATARRLTTWHYQWLILHEFLPLFVGHAMVGDILRHGRRFYAPALGEAFMPVDFQGAAYRMGHSMVRPSYRANLAGDHGKPFFAFIFDPADEGQTDPGDLRGGARSPRRFVGWQTFFDFGDGQVKRNKRIDTKLSTPLFHLPLGAIANHQAPTALPQRTLLRQLTWQLPSGQSIARRMGVAALARKDVDELSGYGVGFERSTPLWYYVLKEAELVADGLHLGPVGGRIVGEVIIGLLQADPAAYLSADPDWRPTVRSPGGEFRMVDFLTFAGVDPTHRGQ